MNFRVVCLVWLSPFLVQPAIAQEEFIKGVYSSAEGCAALKTKTEAEGDFVFLSAKGFEGIEFNCQFVQVYSRKELPGWVAVAFCEEPEHWYPGLFSIIPLNETTLSVGMPENAEQDSEEEPAAAAPAEDDEEESGLAGEYGLCPPT